MQKKYKALVGVLVAAICFSVIYIANSIEKDIIHTEAEIVEAKIEVPENLEFGINIDSFMVIKSDIKKNQFLANILLPFNIDYQKIALLAQKSKDVFDVRKIAAGDPYTILASKDSSKTAQYFIYQPNSIDYVVYDLRDSVKITKGQKEVKIRENSVSGIINSSLYEALQKSGASPELAIKMADVFAWAIDFYRIQKGDWFKVIYEEMYVDDQAVGIKNIQGIQFNHFDSDYYAFHFENDSVSDYYDEEANSLRKAFLKSPLKFSRLTSRYTMRRFHPVQKRWKAHLGTDYAAPKGSPIMSTGDGVVIESSYTSGNGNYVKIKHNSVYTTQYLHMSKRNVKVGQRVRQGDIIGFVGSTGLATGPHVCYRFWKNGKQVDHLRQDLPSVEPLKEEYKEEFAVVKSELMDKLQAIEIKVIPTKDYSKQLSMVQK